MARRARYVPRHARRAPRRRGRRLIGGAALAAVAAVPVAAVVRLTAGGGGAVVVTGSSTTLSATSVVAVTPAPVTTAPAATAPVTTAPVTTAPAATAPVTTAPATTVAGRTFGPGDHRVGTGPGQLPPGIYRTRSAPTLAMRCEVTLFDGEVPRTPIAAHGPVIVETSGATAVRVGRACPPLTDDLRPVLTPDRLSAPEGIPAGMYFAVEIPPGTYEALADGRPVDPLTGRRCYWSIQRGFTAREFPAAEGGDEVAKNRVTDRPQRTRITISEWDPRWFAAGVTFDYRMVAENRPADGIPDAEVGPCTFRRVG